MGYSIAYNSGSTTPFGTFKQGTITMGLKPQEYTVSSGFTWYANATTPNDNYLIISDTYSQGWSDQQNSKPTIWRSETGTTESFVSLVNQLPDVNGVTGFTDSGTAMKYLMDTGKYFVSKDDYIGIPSSGLTVNLDAGWYPSYSGNGTTWYDTSTSENNFTLINGALFDSTNGGTIYLDGTDDYIVSSKDSNILGSSPRTYIGWYKIITIPNAFGQILTTGNGDCIYKMFGLGRNLNNLRSWGGCYDADTGVSLPLDTWVFIAVSYDGVNFDTYINENTSRISRPLFNTTQSKIFIGLETTNDGGSFRFAGLKGYVGSFYQYNRFLSSEEISQLYNATKGRFGL
jgi:hypothetical protein